MKIKLITLFFLTLALNPIFSQIKKTVLQLSQARSGMGVIAYGDKIICAGGGVPTSSNNLSHSKLVEIIDSRTFTFSQMEMPATKMKANVFNWRNKVMFVREDQVNNSQIDIYDFEKNIWSSEFVKNNFSSTLMIDDKVYFFNGSYFPSNSPGLAVPTGIIDVYNFQIGSWSSIIVPEQRTGMILYAYNKKLYILGGRNSAGMSKRVDIYDTETAKWSLGGTLVNPRNNTNVSLDYTQIGSKIIFADGEIYDMSQNKSVAKPLNIGFTYTTALTNDNTAYFAGGYNFNSNVLTTTDSIKIYNDNNNTWTTAILSESRTKITATKVFNKILFVGGYSSNGASKVIDIYNTKTQKWTIDSLNAGRYNIKAAVSGNKLFLVDGDVSIFSPAFVSLNFSFDPSTNVDVLEFPDEITPSVLEPELEIFPNPFNSELTIRWSPKTDNIAKLKIFNSIGQNILTTTIQNNQKVLSINQLATGTYLIYLETLKGILTKKVVKY